jgi:hypothetical protein
MDLEGILMMKSCVRPGALATYLERIGETLAGIERAVVCAPATPCIQVRTEDTAFSYRAPFSVTDHRGRIVFVEAPLTEALTIPNMSRFVLIDNHIRSLGWGFLVLVPKLPPLAVHYVDEFRKLHIRTAVSSYDVTAAVEEEWAMLDKKHMPMRRRMLHTRLSNQKSTWHTRLSNQKKFRAA